ncbi:helix-turn-helix domain-containing protein [Streptomyces sp. S6]|nr:helix-turn-helix domain-containing protein [Streptomyces sp. S6]
MGGGPCGRWRRHGASAGRVRISRAAFYRLRARGNAPRCLKLPNGQIRIRCADLDAWFEGCECPRADVRREDLEHP